MTNAHAVSASDEAQHVPVDIPLSSTAQRLYGALRAAGEAVRDHRQYHPGVTVVTFFAPLEAVALSIGVTRQTIYNRLPELVDAGLVSQRAHYTTHRGQTKSDGSLWSVRLNPGERDTAPQIDHDYLKASYRDLGADIAAGRTAWSALQSKPEKTEQIDIIWITRFAITPTLKNSNKDDCKTERNFELESLLDVKYAYEGETVNEAVDLAARAIGQTLGTGAGSLNLWRYLVWALVRLQKATERDFYYQVYMMVQRTGVDRREGGCRNAGGLLVHRLKASGIWEELRRCPQVRVGMRPTGLT